MQGAAEAEQAEQQPVVPPPVVEQQPLAPALQALFLAEAPQVLCQAGVRLERCLAEVRKARYLEARLLSLTMRRTQ